MDVDSVRVTGLGDARLFEASCRVKKRETRPRKSEGPSSDSERVRGLKEKKTLLMQEKDVSESALSLLRDYGKTLSGEHITPTVVDAFIDQYLARGTALVRTAAKLDEEIHRVQRDIDDFGSEDSSRKGETDGKVSVTIMAKAQTEVLLKLIYGKYLT